MIALERCCQGPLRELLQQLAIAGQLRPGRPVLLDQLGDQVRVESVRVESGE
ncbi:hypothetical protein AB0F73_01880 [Micromonospora purpureochromogenes]|uniref:hypothetical protein n=1 Tax=Micromonospora purpureochromogenes TaxID=47872 RepID=UPI0033D0BF72